MLWISASARHRLIEMICPVYRPEKSSWHARHLKMLCETTFTAKYFNDRHPLQFPCFECLGLHSIFVTKFLANSWIVPLVTSLQAGSLVHEISVTFLEILVLHIPKTLIGHFLFQAESFSLSNEEVSDVCRCSIIP